MYYRKDESGTGSLLCENSEITMRHNVKNINYLLTGDPSDIVQYFPRFSINVHCCRYWWLKKWEHNTLSFPFWRIYYNFEEGGVIEYQGKSYAMLADKVYLIAPNTDYKSRLNDHRIPGVGYRVEGGSINSATKQTLDRLLSEGAIEHLFMHFTLGFPYDNVLPGIYMVDLDENLIGKIAFLRQQFFVCSMDLIRFDVPTFLVIQSLICEILQRVDKGIWERNAGDMRVAKIVNYIENHYDQDLSNDFLADMVCMSTNSFSRLFKHEMGVPLQKYIKKKRIDYACLLITHSNYSIDEIAFKTGFSNRFHFTRVFHEIARITPARYKTQLSL